jgi:hypothetical protein
MARESAEETRVLVYAVTGTRALGAPLATDFSTAYAPLPPAPRNANYIHSWLQYLVSAQQRQMDEMMLAMFTSNFGRAHSGFRLMITCAVRAPPRVHASYPPPPDVYRSYLATVDNAVRIAVFRILGVSHDEQTTKARLPQLRLAITFGARGAEGLTLT